MNEEAPQTKPSPAPQQPMPTNPLMVDTTQAPTPQSVSTPPASPPRSRKKLIVLLVIPLILVIGSAVIYLLVISPQQDEQDNQADQLQTQQDEQDNQADQPQTQQIVQESSATGTTQLTSGTATVTVSHPESWEVEVKDQDGSTKVTTIKSPKGYYLRLSETLGVGFACSQNSYSYTLTQKVATASSNIFFTEFTTTNPRFPIKYFEIQDFNDNLPGNTTKKVGDSATDTCTLPAYPIVGGTGAENSVQVNIGDQAKGANELLTYAEVSKDSEFMTMLQTLTVENR